MSKSLLYAHEYPANDKISITIPTIGEILEDEESYYSLVSCVTATPYDFMVQLEDIGVDFSKITSFELFMLLFAGMQNVDTHLVFGELDLKKFQKAIDRERNAIVLVDHENDIVIDEYAHSQICDLLRKINCLEKNDKKPGNEAARKYMIKRARIKQKRAAKKPKKSQIEDLIISMVNTEQYKYDYGGTLGLTIYQFHSSVHQIIKKINFDNTMIGCYAGTVDTKKLDQDALNWLKT